MPAQVTCGEDGALYHWDMNKDKRDPTEVCAQPCSGGGGAARACAQVSFGAEQQDNIAATRLVQNGLPLNCLAYEQTSRSLVVGTDSETLLLLQRAL